MSVALIALLAIGSMASGAEPERSEPAATAVLAHLSALRDGGQVAEARLIAPPASSVSASSKLIVLIQDVHVDYETQQQIAGLLEKLIAQDGLRLILAEGGSGDVSVSRLRDYHSTAARRELAERYLRAGVFSGHEYVDLVSDAPLRLWGVEDAERYADNMERFLDVERVRPAVEPQVASLRQAAAEAAWQRLTPAARTFLERAQQADADSDQTNAYMTYLLAEATRLGIARSAYPALRQFAEMSRQDRWDGDLDLAALFEELHRLRQELAPRVAASPEERQWLEALDVLGSLERLIGLQWMPEDDRAFHATPARYAVSAWLPFLRGQGVAWDGEAAPLDDALAAAVRFYEAAERRNAEMVRRSFEKMDAERQPLAALIMGGFHTDALSRRLIEGGAQVIVVTMTGGASHDAARYHDVLKAKYHASRARRADG